MGSPHLSRKRDQIKMRDYMDRRVTPPKRVISPSWGYPLPCKRALTNVLYKVSLTFFVAEPKVPPYETYDLISTFANYVGPSRVAKTVWILRPTRIYTM